MNKKDCARADKCVFAENCEWNYAPRANYLCFCRRAYSRYEAALAERDRKKMKGGAGCVRMQKFN